MSGGTGVWLVGGRGSVATTAVLGAAAVRNGLAAAAGLVSEHADFAAAGLPPLADLVFGGHDVVRTPLVKRAEELAGAGVVPADLLAATVQDLHAADAEIRDGVQPGGTRPQAEEAARLAADLTGFRERHRLARVVVINVSSTEPPAPPHPGHGGLTSLERALETGADVLPPSSLYAYAAFRAGCPFVDFTPSTGARLPALDQLAHLRGLPYAGSDGKTGETLVRSALAPMFGSRRLHVLAWSGTNLLGGGDGATLAGPAPAASKTASKRRVLGVLGEPVTGEVHIDHVPELGEWKTAWDHVLFEGFLGVRMALQFTWQGCDSALAAPLVLDLARFMARAHEAGERGALGALAFYFKDPVGTGEQRLAAQYDLLRSWARWWGEGA